MRMSMRERRAYRRFHTYSLDKRAPKISPKEKAIRDQGGYYDPDPSFALEKKTKEILKEAFSDEEEIRVPSKKKDTKYFCKGDKNKPHEGEWKPADSNMFNTYYIFICKNCGKKMRYCWNWSNSSCICGHHERNK